MGNDSSSIRELAGKYLARGWMPLPVPFKTKNPGFTGWQNFTATRDDLPNHFNGQRQNIGVLLGQVSGSLVDVDLDCPEALRIAPRFLPQTSAVFGRAGNPRSHWLYICDAKTEKFLDPLAAKGRDEKATLLEIRSTGGQTVFPGSVHPSGETICWDTEGEPAPVEAQTLRQAAAHLAAAALLGRYWPKGARHDASLALAGGLLRAGWTEAQTEYFIEAIGTAAQDEETRERVANVITTAKRLSAKETASGWPTLAKLIDEKVISKARAWLGIEASQAHTIEKASETTSDVALPVLPDAALYGLAGEIVRFIEPHTEASNVALLIQLLAGFGILIGRTAYFRAEDDFHYTKLNAVLVGASSKGRIGAATGDKIADEILDALRETPEGLNKTQIHDLFKRNRSAGAITGALRSLLELGRIESRSEKTEGRPREVYSLRNDELDEKNETSPDHQRESTDSQSADDLNSSNSFSSSSGAGQTESETEREVWTF